MRKPLSVVFALALLLAAPFALQAAESSWTGWITDSGCGAKGANAGHVDCAKKCVEGGAKLVLYVTETQKLYTLSDQTAAMSHLGHVVVVTGTLEGDAITVAKIAKAEG